MKHVLTLDILFLRGIQRRAHFESPEFAHARHQDYPTKAGIRGQPNWEREVMSEHIWILTSNRVVIRQREITK